MKPFEIFKITIVERIFVVPLDLHRDRTLATAGQIECFDMIHLVRNSFARDVVDALLDDERHRVPILGLKTATQPLRSLCLAAAASDNLLDRDRSAEKHGFELRFDIGEVASKNGLGMTVKLYLKSGIDD